MFGLFNWNSIEEEKDDCNDEYDFDDFLKYTKFETEKYGYIICPIKNFIFYVESWFGQRQLNEKHIDTITTGIIENGYIIGSFKILLSKQRKEIKLIDGQHRCRAIYEIIKKYPKFNPTVIIEVFYIDDIDSEESLKIFIQGNTNLALNTNEDIPSMVSCSLVKELGKLYPDVIIDLNEGKRCNRPNTSKKLLRIKLEAQLKRIKSKKSIDKIVSDIIELNNSHSVISRKEFNKFVTKQITENMYLKACNSGWYLGLYPDNSWVCKLK